MGVRTQRDGLGRVTSLRGLSTRDPSPRPASLGATTALVVVALSLALAAVGVPGGAAAAADPVTVQASVGGQPLAQSSGNHPTRLDPATPTTVSVRVTNGGTSPVSVRTVRLDGRVVGLTFFAYDTAVRLDVAPGKTETLRFPLDLTGLDGQATGLLPGSLKLLDAKRHVLASQTYVADVRGSLWSVYGLFGLALVVLTALSFAGLLFALARHRLPTNRLQRGLRFLATGIGVGLVVTFFLSAVRLFVPQPGGWLLFAVVFALVFFAVGYLAPTPDEPGEEDDIDEGLVLEEDGTVTAPVGPAGPPRSAP